VLHYTDMLKIRVKLPRQKGNRTVFEAEQRKNYPVLYLPSLNMSKSPVSLKKQS